MVFQCTLFNMWSGQPAMKATLISIMFCIGSHVNFRGTVIKAIICWSPVFSWYYSRVNTGPAHTYNSFRLYVESVV
jgi:hypothetical protein